MDINIRSLGGCTVNVVRSPKSKGGLALYFEEVESLFNFSRMLPELRYLRLTELVANEDVPRRACLVSSSSTSSV